MKKINDKNTAYRLEVQKVLGEEIVKRRTNKKMQQKNLMFASELPQATLSALENGNLNYTLDTLISVARAYKTSIAALQRHKIFHRKLF
jgi:transcriptional regulator with XRE-family HTH domain